MNSAFGIEHGEFSKANSKVFSGVEPRNKRNLIIMHDGLNEMTPKLRSEVGINRSPREKRRGNNLDRYKISRSMP